MNLLRRLWHRVEHRFGWFGGQVETHWQTGRLMVGFRCNRCGRLFHVEPVSGKQMKAMNQMARQISREHDAHHEMGGKNA